MEVTKERSNQEWLDELQTEGMDQAAALQDLRLFLLRGALLTLSRIFNAAQENNSVELLALAEDCAQEALVTLLHQLPTFRDESKFTTWAYSFAIHKAYETARREQKKAFSLDQLSAEEDRCGWIFNQFQQSPDPDQAARQVEIIQMLQSILRDELTSHQRMIVKAMVFDDVPMDILTERLATNRNAIYKTLHDARKKIKKRFEEHGVSMPDIWDLFHANAGDGSAEKGRLER